MIDTYTPHIQTVTEITHSIKGLLENGFSFVAIRGEVSNLRKPYSGHIYFTLKDHESQIKAVLFKTQQRYLDHELNDGIEIICRGRISLYAPRGEYQIITDTIDFAGSGDLQVEYDKLKKLLEKEGLFDLSHKLPLPFLPEKIAIITAPNGAAVHDFLQIANKRFDGMLFQIYPVRVQGENAASEVISSIHSIQENMAADVIVICRGGGSIEDLWAFNNEQLARTVYDCTIPIVSAIGHEIDFTILDFVADHRAPTPTAAAEAVLPEKRSLQQIILRNQKSQYSSIASMIANFKRQLELQRRLLRDPYVSINHLRLQVDHLQNKLCSSMYKSLDDFVWVVNNLSSRIDHSGPVSRIIHNRTTLKNISDRMHRAFINVLQHKRKNLNNNTSLLNAVNPQAILKRGYSIVSKAADKSIVNSVSQVKQGDNLEVVLNEGSLGCEVEKISN